MEKNLGNYDRIIRVVVGIVFIVLNLTHVVTGTLGIIFLVLGVIFLITSAIGSCCLYKPLGLNTKGKQEEGKE